MVNDSLGRMPGDEPTEYPKLDSIDAVDNIANETGKKIDAFSLTKDQLKLQELRERGELAPHDFDLNELYQFIENRIPLTAALLGKQAVVLTRGQFEQLGGYLDITLPGGEEICVEAESMNEPILIIFPGDLG